MNTASDDLRMEGVTLGYDEREVSTSLDLSIEPGSFTVIIGPNACGKTTALRGLANLLKPRAGTVLLAGRDIHTMRTKDLAKRLGVLPQSAIAPDGITVRDLVARGRYPHQGLLSRWTRTDDLAIEEALAATSTTDLSERYVDELSGGQRQRVWVAMALAQQTDILLLDEPTTYLDISHQISLLDLFASLHGEGRTIAAVLHDINHAARYATHLIAMKDGGIAAQGDVRSVITPALLADVFGLEAAVIDDPVNGGPLVVPRHVAAARGPAGPPTLTKGTS